MYNDEELAIFFFCSFDKISNKKLSLIFELNDSICYIKSHLIEYKNEIIDIVGHDLYLQIKMSNTDYYLNKLLQNMDNAGAKFTTYKSDDYLKQLLDIDDFPFILYYKGNLDIARSKCIGIVGTRKPTRYGIIVTKQFSKDLSLANCTIVSGGARGVDSIALREALDNNSSPVIVLGCGVDVVYPPENSNLFKETIEKGGLILSEYSLKTPPNSYNFPLRNRIISGISLGILVTEAGLKSGTMITAGYALEQNKEVFLVPGNINSLTSSGTNNMLKDGYGNLVTEPNDILGHYKINLIEKEETPIQLDFNEATIIELIRKEGEAHFEQILQVVDLNLNDLNNLLFEMQMKGLIVKLPGNYYGV